MKYFYDQYLFHVPEEVYPPEADSELLADYLSATLRSSDTVWDLGTGCGIQAIISREFTTHVVASDVNPFAGTALHMNCQQNGISPIIPFFLGALDSPLNTNLTFSKILFNAPYLSSSNEKPPATRTDYWLNKTWNGGEDGTKIIQGFFNLLPSRLQPQGQAYLVYSVNPSSIDYVWDLACTKKLHPKKIKELPFFYETLILLELSL